MVTIHATGVKSDEHMGQLVVKAGEPGCLSRWTKSTKSRQHRRIVG